MASNRYDHPQLKAFPPHSPVSAGHYAHKSWSTPSSPSDIPRPKLLRPRDRHKDQTYYLSSISEQSLSRALFPLGDLTKLSVRLLAQQYGLPTAEREESMGICFVGEKRKFSGFVCECLLHCSMGFLLIFRCAAQYLPPKRGPIVNLTTGAEIGTHEGLWTYTIGQGAKIKGMPERMFVAEKHPHSNTIYVVPGTYVECSYKLTWLLMEYARNHEALYCRTLHVKDWKWIWSDSPPPELTNAEGFRARMQFRHVMPATPCTVQKLVLNHLICPLKY
jgi:tRNA-5-taurinomethyluridine 2-sulfurtransferase